MSNEQRASANKEVMSRDQMHVEALVIENLIGAAMALNLSVQPGEMVPLLELAHERAGKLHEALDGVHARGMGQ